MNNEPNINKTDGEIRSLTHIPWTPKIISLEIYIWQHLLVGVSCIFSNVSNQPNKMFKLYVVIATVSIYYVSGGTFPNNIPYYFTFPPKHVSSHHTSSHYQSKGLCVLPGTCLSGSTTTSNTIDIRIVTGVCIFILNNTIFDNSFYIMHIF